MVLHFFRGVTIDSVENSAVLLLLSEFDICISTRFSQLSLALICQFSSCLNSFSRSYIAYH